jgi:hypothetical protein
MATLAGNLNPPFLAGTFPDNQPNFPPSEGLPVGFIVAGVMMGEAEVGELDQNQPIDMHGRTFVGYEWRTFFHDYYNRVWLVPNVVDFGSLTTTTTSTVFMWNAHLDPVTLDEIEDAPDASLSLSGLDVPMGLKALAGTYFGVVADINGDPSINSKFSFVFGTEVVELPVLGTRSRLWPWPPNWDDGFEVTYTFKTEIITSSDGSEQRQADRQTPRKEFRFESIVHEGQWREFVRHVNVWQGRATIMPEFSKFFRNASAMIDGQNFILADTVPDWLVTGVLVVFIDKDRRVLRTVESVVGNTVTLNANVEGDWLASTKIFKAVSGRLGAQMGGNQHTNRTATISVTFSADPGVEVYPDAGAPTFAHNGRELFLKRPNWADTLSPSFQTHLETVDYGTGRIDYFLPITFNDRFHKGNYVAQDIASANEVEKFHRRVAGQLREFYMPTFTEDLVIMETIPLGTVSMRIAGPETANDYAIDTVYKDLIIFFHDGTYLVRRVQNIYAVDDSTGNDTIIQVTEAFPFEVAPSAIRQICWLPLWRMATDALTFNYLTDEVAEFALNMKTLEYEDAE